MKVANRLNTVDHDNDNAHQNIHDKNDIEESSRGRVGAEDDPAHRFTKTDLLLVPYHSHAVEYLSITDLPGYLTSTMFLIAPTH